MFFIKTIICFVHLSFFSFLLFFFFCILLCHGELNGPSIPGNKVEGPEPWSQATRQSSKDRAQVLWALPFGVRVPSASLLSLPCSLHHPRPSFPALCSRLVFPHHPHHGVLCVSALSEDPEAQFCVSLHQLPHRCEMGRQALSLGRPPPWGGPGAGPKDKGGGGICDVRTEKILKHLLCCLLYEVSHPQARCEDGYFITPPLWGFPALCTSS